MQLIKLIKNLSVKEIKGKLDKEIEEIKIDSNAVTSGDLFICIKGGDYDGHDYAKNAEQYGAEAIICERILEVSIPQIIVDDSRQAMSALAREFYGNPDKKLKLIAVVGTNGKTSTTHLIKKILDTANVKCGVIGTLGIYYGEKFIEPSLTTPDPLEMYKLFRDMVDDGVKAVVMEVSAHAVHFGKVKGLNFEVGVFTNFTRDHLDFFHDMDSYKQAKLNFFKENNCKYVVANSDDQVGLELSKIREDTITYGIYNPADVFGIDLNFTKLGSSFVLNLFDCIYNVKLNMIGEFNVYNALASATATALFGIKTDKIIKALNIAKSVSGRLECVYDDNFTVFVDYAHTPDGLEKSLVSLRKVCDKRLVCVFGCGGNRDKGKRAEMGKISGELADFTIITSDNPRYEEPMGIMMEIETGILESSKKYILIQDRVEAIRYAIEMVSKGDVILIAGKGSEKYQETLGIKRVYNDKDTVNEIIRG